MGSESQTTSQVAVVDDAFIYSFKGNYPRALMLVVTMRLGMSRIESEYYEPIARCFDLP